MIDTRLQRHWELCHALRNPDLTVRADARAEMKRSTESPSAIIRKAHALVPEHLKVKPVRVILRHS